MRFSWLVAALPTILAALPHGPHVAQGPADILRLGEGEMEIRAGKQALIEWDGFSIGTGERVAFLQPDAQSLVLNRVLGSNPSELLGSLAANGQVWLINPQGILVGPDSRIDTGAFLASALDWVEGDPFSGKEVLFADGSSVAVLGTVRADGDIVLLGAHLDMNGTVEAGGKLSAGAGLKILLEADRGIFVFAGSKELGETGILAGGSLKGHAIDLQANGNLYRNAICLDGIAEATEMKEQGGKIYLTSNDGTVLVKGRLKASGGEARVLGKYVGLLDEAAIDVSGETPGTVLIGGDYQGSNSDVLNADAVFAGPKTQIRADGGRFGRGGKVIVWSEEATRFYGAISAQGGTEAGDGGFIEISGGFLDFLGSARAESSYGKAGSLLLDPTDILIQTLPGDNNITAAPSFEPSGAASQLTPLTLETALGMFVSVTVASSGTIDTGAEPGNITVNNQVMPGGAGNLILTTQVPGVTQGSIIINAPILLPGAATLELLSQNNLEIHDSITTNTGSITMEAASGSLTIEPTLAVPVTVSTSDANIIIQNIGQNMTLRGGPNMGEPATIRTINTGNITIDVPGTLSIIAGDGSSSYANIRTMMVGDISVQVGGDLILNGGGAVSVMLANSAAGIVTGTIGATLLTVDVGGSLFMDSVTSNEGFLELRSAGTGGLNLTVAQDISVNENSNIGTTFNLTAQGETNIVVGNNFSAYSAGGAFNSGSFLSDANVSVGGNLSLNMAVFGGIGSYGAHLNIDVGGSISLDGSAYFAQINLFGPGDVTILAGANMSIQGASQITNLAPGGAVNLVVDNLNPAFPMFGLGGFSLGPSASLNTNAGALRIFTSQPGVNSIQGLLNGLPFDPGKFLDDSLTQQWGYYFFTGFYGGTGYTVFYKLDRVLITLLLQNAFASYAELFRRLHPFSEYIRWGESFVIAGETDEDVMMFLRRRSVNNGEANFSLQEERVDRPEPL